MSSGLEKPYGVKETGQFLADVANYLGDFKRWDEIKETFDLDVARKPRIFEQIPGTEYYGVPLQTRPIRVVYFSVDDESETIVLERLI